MKPFKVISGSVALLAFFLVFAVLFYFDVGGITGAAIGAAVYPLQPVLEPQVIPFGAISALQADGLIAYGELNIAIPRFRAWNASNNFSVEQNAQSIGTDGTNDITWVVTRANHERDEIILGTEDKGNDVNLQVYNATAATWGALLEVSADVLISSSRAFDIAVEDVSGDALIVYEGSSTADTVVSYRIWNGSRYSEQNSLVTGLPASQIRWLSLTPKRGSDDIMLLIHDNAADLHAFPWNGTAFDTNVKNSTLSTATGTNIVPHFAFAWEESSGEGLAVYAGGTNLVYRTFSPTAPHWSAETTIALGNGLSSTRLCSDPTSDYIGIIVQDAGNDVNARMWNGSQILASPPTEDIDTEPSGANNVNIDCAWYGSTTALFGFVDLSGVAISYFNFTKPNAWSLTDLTTAPVTAAFASDDIDGLRFAAHPTTSEIMILAMDILEDITAIRWSGAGFAAIGESPLETSTEVLTAAQEAVMFDWYRYDPVPNVTAIQPSSLNFPPGATIEINTTVVDNILVGMVLANVTLPNGTIQQLMLTNRTGNNTFYNASFSSTTLSGIYTIRIIANDTSVHKNANSTETALFTIGDAIPPAVTNITPTAGSNVVRNTVISIAANVTDNVGVSAVFANITFPNGSIERLQLFNSSFSRYNQSFSSTSAIGTYTIRFIANDTSNMINSSETTFVVIIDPTAPIVTNITPATGTDFLQNFLVSITANVTDDVGVSAVFANITFPNGSIERLQLFNRSAVLYNSTFNITRDTGTYTLRIIANDTSNNLNASETSSFTISGTVVTVPVTVEQLSCSLGIEVDETAHCSFFTRYANGTVSNQYAFTYNITNSSQQQAFTGIANNTQRFGRYVFSFVPTIMDTYGIIVGNESLGFAGATQVAVLPRRGLTNDQERNLNRSLSNLSESLFRINQTTATIFGNINNQTQVVLSDLGEVAADSKYRTKMWTFDFQGSPKAPDATPVVTLYDPLRNIIVQSVAMTALATGVFEYEFTTTSSHTAGVWETQVNVTSNARPIQLSDYWELESSPAQVKINSMTDTAIPTITADITITNEGSAAFEYQYEYCIVAEESNQCGGGDDLGYASAAKLIAAGTDFNTQLTLSDITQAGTLYFKLAVYFGTEKSGATRSFTATTAAAEAPAAAGGGGAAGAVPSAAVPPGALSVAVPTAPVPGLPPAEITQPLRLPGTLFDVAVSIPQKYQELLSGDTLVAVIKLLNIGHIGLVTADLEYNIWNAQQQVLFREYATKTLENEVEFVKETLLPADLEPGDYSFVVILRYGNDTAVAGYPFKVIAARPGFWATIGQAFKQAGRVVRDTSFYWGSFFLLVLLFLALVRLLHRKRRK